MSKAIQEERDSLKKNNTWEFVNKEEVTKKEILHCQCLLI